MSKPNEPKTQTVSDALKHAIEKFPTTPIAEVKATVLLQVGGSSCSNEMRSKRKK